MPIVAYSFGDDYPSSRRAVFDNWQRVLITSDFPVVIFVAVCLRQNKRNLPAVYRYPLNFHWFVLRHKYHLPISWSKPYFCIESAFWQYRQCCITFRQIEIFTAEVFESFDVFAV